MPTRTTSESITYTKEIFVSSEDLTPEEKSLVDAATAAMGNAYAPYSHFLVGAAVRTKTGEIITGSNQELANLKGSCAERVALNTAGHEGHRKAGITAIAVAGKPRDSESEKPVTPCGDCRQLIREWVRNEGDPIILLMASSQGEVWRVVGLRSLLPDSFGPDDLGIEP